MELMGVNAELVFDFEMDVSYELPKLAFGVPGGAGGFWPSCCLMMTKSSFCSRICLGMSLGYSWMFSALSGLTLGQYG